MVADIEVIVVDTLQRLQAVLSQATHFNSLKHVVVMDEIPYSFVAKAKNFKLEGMWHFVNSAHIFMLTKSNF